jgi:hypothetical protein
MSRLLTNKQCKCLIKLTRGDVMQMEKIDTESKELI